MATRIGTDVLRAALSSASAKRLTDRELLSRFSEGDQTAFEIILNRYANMVLGVCRRMLPTIQDAEDACQATFLILARKAQSGVWQASIANWLYTTARRVASKANRTIARRLKHESGAMPTPPLSALDQLTGREVFAALDEELEKLQSIYREPLVLCYLQGLSREEAAIRLAIPSGILKSQLERGRQKLAEALTRRGIIVSVGMMALAATSTVGASSPQLIQSTLTTIGGSPSASVAELAKGVAMNGFSLKTKVLALILMATAMMGFGLASMQIKAEPEKANEKSERKEANAKSADTAKPAEAPKLADSAIGFTSRPALRSALELDLSQTLGFAWSEDGAQLAIHGFSPQPGNAEAQHRLAIVSDIGSKNPKEIAKSLPETTALVGFAPDGTTVVTELREYELLSGFHRLSFWDVGESGRPLFPRLRIVNLNPDPTKGMVFSRDGLTFRTVRTESGKKSNYTQLEVCSVSAETGKVLKTLLTIDGEFIAFHLAATGKQFAVMDAKDRIAVWDVDRAEKLWTTVVRSAHKSPPTGPTATPTTPMNVPPIDDPQLPPPSLPKERTPDGRILPFAGFETEAKSKQTEAYAAATLALSPDGSRVLYSRGIGRPIVLDGRTGKTLPDLEKAELLFVGGPLVHYEPSRVEKAEPLGYGQSYFTRDGRLLALCGTQFDEPEATPFEVSQYGYQVKGQFLSVWDTNTGKLLKKWNQHVEFAVCPTRPILAIVENNRMGGMRLGFWDFSGEKPVEK